MMKILLSCLAVSAVTTAFSQIAILPLGDSITRGEVASAGFDTPRGGYRWRLEDRLQGGGYNFDFIGSQSDPGWTQDDDHEGHGGWRIADLFSLVDTNVFVPQADAIMLMIGTNDLGLSVGTSDMVDLSNQLTDLINRIKNRSPDARVLTSTIPNSTGAADGWLGIVDGEVDSYNDVVRDVVSSLAWRGVSLVDGNASIGFNLDDGLHPDQSGELLLGDAWYNEFNGFDWSITQDGAIRNLSTRGFIGTGNNVLIAGIIIDGVGTKQVQVNARGQSLPASVAGRISDPQLRVVNGAGTVVLSSDNWPSEPFAGLISASIAGPPGSPSDASAILNLGPGAWTIIVDGVGGATGVGIVEIIDIDPANTAAKIANVSTRGFVGTGDNVLIGGIIVDGPTANSVQRVLVNGRGPSVSPTVGGRISDPFVSIHDQSGAAVAFGDDWTSEPSAPVLSSAPVGTLYGNARPPSPFEASTIRDLPRGGTTAILYDKNGNTGIGIVEFFAAPSP